MIPKYYILVFTVFSIFYKEAVQADEQKCLCGRKTDHSFRIVGGRIAEPETHPWMAALSYRWFKIIFCGGSLINDRYVLTAGHCVRTFPDYITVILGLYDTSRIDEGEEFGLENILVHPDFKDTGVNDINDIALLKLNKVVTYSKKIRPVCLPYYPVNDYAGETAQVVGWGKTRYKSSSGSKLLKETELKILSKEDCKRHEVIGRYVLNSMICGYQNGTDTCQGDSGGPLTYETPLGKNVLIGVVSWGIECAKPNTPGVYTRVSSFIDWIHDNTYDAYYCKHY